MKRWRNKALLAFGASALIVAIPALGQQTPESLLPPGFGDPEPPPPPQNDAEPAETPAVQPAPDQPAGVSRLQGLEGIIADASQEDLEALANLPEPIEIPEASRRSTDVVGVLEPESTGLGFDAFRGANGRFLSTLMRRLDAPLPSRWTSILLRRALLSRIPAPSHVHPVDWAAERAWLLLRMGEADAARMLVQSVDVDQFTPKMFSVAVQTALATADPAALCPLVKPGRETSDEPVWALSDAMCAALEGDAGRASALIDQARRRGRARGIDITLAEKVIGAGLNTRRAVTIEWDDVDELNSWRFGLAAATGVQIPAALLNRAGPHVRAWHARAALLPIDQRVEAAHTAAALGVFSNASLVEMYSLIADTTDPSEFGGSVGERLQQAYSARTVAGRMDGIRGLWDNDAEPLQRYGRLILTATAATRIPPNPALGENAGNLIASMLSAGYDRHAARWSAVVEGMDGADADRAWAMLAVGSARPRVTISAGRLDTFHDNDESVEKHRTRLLAAALAGLGRLEPEAATSAAGGGMRLDAQNGWSRMLDQAARSRQVGTVALLCAVGMQTGGWAGVPPEHLYHITRALRMVGRDYEARMIAAEALARL